MNNPVHHLQVLHNNPFIFASAFIGFFGELGEKEQSLLLGYLVLPITLHLPSREFLKEATRRSSLRSMLRDRSRIHGLEDRVVRYREMTNISVQYLLDSNSITIHSRLAVTVADQQSVDIPSPDGVIKAARRLGILFRPYDVPMIFRMTGVMSL